MLAMGRTHCATQLAITPNAAAQLQRIVAAMQRCTAWLPVGPLAGHARGGGGGTAAPADPAAACLAVHFWLVAVLAFCLPAIVIHRLEGQERQAEHPRKSGRGQPSRTASGGGAERERERDLLLQRPQSALRSSAELVLAAYAAWLAVQLAMQVLDSRA